MNIVGGGGILEGKVNGSQTDHLPQCTAEVKDKRIIIIIIITIKIIPADRNVVQKEAEKKLKYRSLCIEIQRMWNLKCTIIPVIIGATRIVTRSLRKNLDAVPGKHSTDSLQKTVIYT